MSTVSFRGVSKRFGVSEVLQPLDLDIRTGEFVSVLGPSGSGKTTLLNVAAGFLAPTQGKFFVDERDITSLPPRRRNIGMVFQNYALFPHMDVGANVAYGLRVRKISSAEIATRVARALQTVQLEGWESRAIASLSGGQQQRVALARAMVIEPDILLMDEPLGALDRQLRKNVQLEIRRMHLRAPRTTLYVTHDQEEALVMSDRVTVMRSGRIEQIGTAEELYHSPANTFVARFLGESNLIPGEVIDVASGKARLSVPGLERPLVGRAAAGVAKAMKAAAMIRPENIRLRPGGLHGRIVERVFLGEITAMRLVVADGIQLWSRLLGADVPQTETMDVGWRDEDVSILPDEARSK
ncbi:MAG: ABC transporter ATP-binding protein [Hyphomicrobiales bacterium]|nr:ABC transporter ATP-binding protein [Hyphomicrobiales bacterium]MBV9977710.1 ABC transporter ATP-binding protein [Hyphomicrobiales bacterium]